MNQRPLPQGYIRVGALLRDELIKSIDGGWEGETAERAAKIHAALVAAAPYRRGYLIDGHGWTWEDYDFLKTILVDGVAADLDHMATSRGFAPGNSTLGRQIRALRDNL